MFSSEPSYLPILSLEQIDPNIQGQKMISHHQRNHLHFLLEWSYSSRPYLKRMLIVILKVNIFLPVTFYKGEKTQDKWMTSIVQCHSFLLFTFSGVATLLSKSDTSSAWQTAAIQNLLLLICLSTLNDQSCRIQKTSISSSLSSSRWYVEPIVHKTGLFVSKKYITANKRRNSFMSFNHLSTHHKSRPTAIRRNSCKLYVFLWPSDSLGGWEEGCRCSIPRLEQSLWHCLLLFSYSYTVTVCESSPHSPTTQTHSTAPVFPVIMTLSL